MNKWNAQIRELGVAGKAAIAVSILLVLGLLLLGGLYGLGTFFFYDSYSSAYEYDASIYIDGDTENAVFLLPLPIQDGEEHLGEVHTTSSDRFVGIDHSIVNTEHGQMLQLEVDEISDGRDVLWVNAHIEADRTIETKEPRNTEPVLSPLELSLVEPDERFDQDRWPDYRQFEATSNAFSEHEGTEDVEIGFNVWHDGTNSWWTFGWNWNQYDTSVSGNQAALDPEGEWVELRGFHREGAGSYPRFPPAPS